MWFKFSIVNASWSRTSSTPQIIAFSSLGMTLGLIFNKQIIQHGLFLDKKCSWISSQVGWTETAKQSGVRHSVPSAWLPLSAWALVVHCRRIGRQVKLGRWTLAELSGISSSKLCRYSEYYNHMGKQPSDQQVSILWWRVCMWRVAQASTCPRNSPSNLEGKFLQSYIISLKASKCF